ncbi:MAG: Nif3-like dinuclear metal center hexameric protein [Clostridia bacterium]|nr:Nif3-like dinuclear metal center hexameric protein [Clostridia bacterium]
MAKVSDFYKFLDSIAPFDTQEDWDNSGFLVGDPDRDVTKVGVCLDVTNDTLNKAAAFGAELVVSHHPVIFDPLTCVLADSPVYRAIAKGISVISAHTCWDMADGGVNDVLAGLLLLDGVEKILPDENGNFMLRAGKLKRAVPAEEFADVVAATLDTVVRVTSPEKMVQTVAVCGGSGASMLPDLKKVTLSDGSPIDAYVTGDAKHNDFLDAIDAGIALLAAGHYETETVSMPVMKKLLETEFPDVEFSYLESAPLIYVG